METVIKEEFAGCTVKQWLNAAGFSRGHITHLKKRDDGLMVNGERVTVRRVLRSGDILEIAVDDRAQDKNEHLVPTKMPLDIVYEDDDMIALNKPFDLATHPSIGHFTDTLANGLAYYFEEKGTPFVFRAVNRLDRDTSGIVLVAKNRISAGRLSSLMKEGRIHKSYIAVLNGRLTPDEGTIEVPIRRRDTGIILRTVCSDDDPHGKYALTAYQTLAACADASVVRAEPVTGRTHQLRVHFSHMGAPIVGDSFYGSAETKSTAYDRMMTRQALHAASLTIELPERALTLEAALPCDMEALIKEIQGEPHQR